MTTSRDDWRLLAPRPQYERTAAGMRLPPGWSAPTPFGPPAVSVSALADPAVAADLQRARREALAQAIADAERRLRDLEPRWKVTGGGGITWREPGGQRPMGVIKRCEDMPGADRRERKAAARLLVEARDREREAARAEVDRLRRCVPRDRRPVKVGLALGIHDSIEVEVPAEAMAEEVADAINAALAAQGVAARTEGSMLVLDCEGPTTWGGWSPTAARQAEARVQRAGAEQPTPGVGRQVRALLDLPLGSAALDLGDPVGLRPGNSQRVVVTMAGRTPGVRGPRGAGIVRPRPSVQRAV